jgi:hypothetical protein
MIAAWQKHYWDGSTPRSTTARVNSLVGASSSSARASSSDSADLLRVELLTNGPANLVSKGFLTEAELAAVAD